jgi:hypothetical protein
MKTKLHPHASSRYVGLTWRKSKRKWEAKIKIKGKAHYLGYFDDEADGARAYDAVVIDQKLDRLLNFPSASGAAGHRTTKKGRTSRHRGVCWNKSKKKWEAKVRVDDKQKSLGYFADEDDAGRAYDAAVRKHYPSEKPNGWKHFNFSADGKVEASTLPWKLQPYLHEWAKTYRNSFGEKEDAAKVAATAADDDGDGEAVSTPARVCGDSRSAALAHADIDARSAGGCSFFFLFLLFHLLILSHSAPLPVVVTAHDAAIREKKKKQVGWTGCNCPGDDDVADYSGAPDALGAVSGAEESGDEVHMEEEEEEEADDGEDMAPLRKRARRADAGAAVSPAKEVAAASASSAAGVSALLYTVTFYANLAHSLTRSP